MNMHIPLWLRHQACIISLLLRHRHIISGQRHVAGRQDKRIVKHYENVRRLERIYIFIKRTEGVRSVLTTASAIRLQKQVTTMNGME